MNKKERWKNECLCPVKRSGGSVPFWRSISASGVGGIVKIDGIVDTDRFIITVLLESLWLGMVLFFSMIWILSTLLKGWNRIWRETDFKHNNRSQLTGIQVWTLKAEEAVWNHLDRERNKSLNRVPMCPGKPGKWLTKDNTNDVQMKSVGPWVRAFSLPWPQAPQQSSR